MIRAGSAVMEALAFIHAFSVTPGVKESIALRMPQRNRRLEQVLLGSFEIILVFIALSATASEASGQQGDDYSLIFYEPFESLEGITENTGSYSGIDIVGGYLGQGVLIDGNDTLSYSRNGNLDLDKGSIEMWVRPQWDGDDGEDHFFFHYWVDSKAMLSIIKGGTNSDLTFYMYHNRPGDPDDAVSYWIGDWNADEWHHIAARWRTDTADSDFLRFYIDRELVAELAGQDFPPLNTSSEAFKIGYVDYGWIQQYRAYSVIDELRISLLVNTDVYLDPSEGLIESDTFPVNISVSDVQDLYGFQLDIIYDEDMLEFQEITEGPFLSSDGNPTFWTGPDVSVPGLLGNVISTRTGMVDGLDGSGVLATLVFSARDKGACIINLTDIVLGDSSSESIATNVYGANFTVCHRGDTNCDLCINTTEMMAFVELWLYNSTEYPMSEAIEAVGLWNSQDGCTMGPSISTVMPGALPWLALALIAAASLFMALCMANTSFRKTAGVLAPSFFLMFLGAGLVLAATCEESDLNGDSDVNVLDVIRVATIFGLSSGDPGFDPARDMNDDGVIDVTDLVEVSENAGCVIQCPDSDGDGYADQACGGADCDDDTSDDPAGCPASTPGCDASTSACAICIYPGATEICDSLDNDCDSTPDDGIPADSCSFVCSGMGYNYNAGRGGELRCCGDDGGEDSPYQSPEASCSDGRDNDCDGDTDTDDPDCISCTTPTGDDFTISSDTTLCPGTYYINDLNDNGVLLMSDGVTLDCDGATLIGDGNGRGIMLDYDDSATVRNCNIRNYQIGIYLHQSSNNLITNNNVRDSWQRQDGDSGYGICLYKNLTTSNNISYNTLSDNFLGLYVVSSPENHFLGNTIQRCEYGAYTNGGPYGDNINNAFYNNLFCDNLINDIFNNVGPTNYGDDNTCSNMGMVGDAYNWNDDGTTGCTYTCPPIANNPPTRGSCTATVSDLAVGAYYRKQSITCTYFDLDGYQDLRYMYIVINYLSGDSSSCDDATDPDCGGAFRYLRDINSFHKSPGEEMHLGNQWSELDAVSSSASCHGNQCDVSFIFYYPEEAFLTDGNDARILAWDRWWYTTAGIRTTQSNISSGPGTDNLFDTHVGEPYACSVIVEPGGTGTLDFGLSLDQPACLRIPNQNVLSASMDMTGNPSQEIKDSQPSFDDYNTLAASTYCMSFTPSETYTAEYIAYREYATDDVRDTRMRIKATNSSYPDFFDMVSSLAYCDIWDAIEGWNWCTLNSPLTLNAGTKYWACASDLYHNPMGGVLTGGGGTGIAARCAIPNGGECLRAPLVEDDALSYMIASASYPESLTLDVGGDGDTDWSHPGALQTTVSYSDASFASEINDYLAFNTTCGNPCLVPMDFSSATVGIIDLTNINIIQ